jgi:hypothetical protein
MAVALAPPLFPVGTCFAEKAVFCRKAVGPSFEMHRLGDARQDEVLETLMVRSAA